jgi:hypothetical protein
VSEMVLAIVRPFDWSCKKNPQPRF